MIRYDEGTGRTPIGFLDESNEAAVHAREAVYKDFFGTCTQVGHEVIPMVPHIDVYQFEPGHRGRNYWTLVTDGMSDLRMTLPDEVGAEFSRVELVFYCDEPRPEYLEMLRFMAHFPHDNATWFGWGHTIPNGQPPAPLFPGCDELTTLIFLSPFIEPDATLSERLTVCGDPVSFLWPVPLSDAECQAKLEKGADYLLDLFDEVSHPHVFTGGRSSYV